MSRLLCSLSLLLLAVVLGCSDSSSEGGGTEGTTTSTDTGEPNASSDDVAGPGWVDFLLDSPDARFESPWIGSESVAPLQLNLGDLRDVGAPRTCDPGGVAGEYRLLGLGWRVDPKEVGSSGVAPVKLLDDAGAKVEVASFAIPYRREVRCTTLSVFPERRTEDADNSTTGGFRHVRDHAGEKRVLLQKPGEVIMPLSTYGLAGRLELHATPGPGGKGDLPEGVTERPRLSVWHGDQQLVEQVMRPRGTTVVKAGLPTGLDQVTIRYEHVQQGSGATTILLETLVHEIGPGVDLLAVPVSATTATVVAYPPALPAAARRVSRSGAIGTLLVPGTASVLGGAKPFEVRLDGEVVASAPNGGEAAFAIDRVRLSRVEVSGTQGPAGNEVWLLQPAALTSVVPEAVRGRERASTEPRDQVVRHLMIGEETRRSLLATAPCRFERAVQDLDGTVLEFSHAVADLFGRQGPPAGVTLSIELVNGSERRVLYEKDFDAAETWHEVRLPLNDTGGTGTLVIQTRARDGAPVATASRFLVAVAEPRIVRPRSERPPNLLIYLIDTLRADRVGCYGHDRETTPRLDRLAKDGIVFENAYSQAPWTRPSIASLFTSMYYSFHGAGKVTGLDAGLTTMAERARHAGFETGAFIANVHVHGPSLNFEQGFSESVGVEKRRGSSNAADVNELVFPWLERHKDRPFFLYVHTIDPHATYDPPAEVAGTFNQGYTGSLTPADTHSRTLHARDLDARDVQYLLDLYDEEILFNDIHFGKLVRRLKDLDLYDDTMIVVTSDHGEEFDEHGGFGHGNRLWEELIKIPLVVKLPGNEWKNTRVSETVGLVDVLPTVASAMGFRGDGSDLQGYDLAPFIAGDLPDTPRELLSEEEPSHRALIGGGIKVIEWFSDDDDKRRLELYDLRKDPGEQHDLAPENPELADQWRARLHGTIHKLSQKFQRWDGLPEGDMSPEMIEALIELGYIDGADVDIN